MSKKETKFFSKHFTSMTIAKKITLLYGGIFSFSLIVISIIVMLNATVLQQNTMKRQLLKSLENIEDYIKTNHTMSEEILSTLLDNKYVEATVINTLSHESYRSAVGELPPFLEGLPQEEMDKGKGKETESDGRFHPQPLMEKGYKISEKKPNNVDSREYMIEGKPGQEFILMEKKVSTGQESYIIQTYKMLSRDNFYLHSFGIRMVIIDILGILAACLIGKYISRIMLRPVEDIREAAERISIEDLSQRIDTDGPQDEMKELKETFNSMIARLEVSFKKQNQFVSDASHELRTPISVIQGYANLINRWGKSDPSVLQESIDSILAETEHMSELIKKLLFLAKGDQAKLHVKKEPMCLNESVQEVMKEVDILNLDIEISCQEECSVMVYGDSDLIKQLLWIHTENALKYAGKGGKIKYKIYSTDEYGFVSIQDNGPGIKEEDIPYIFDRFYRVDKSRNKEIPGTGLGLSIAKWIAESHEGTITVNNVLEGGTIFIDSFPLWKEDNKKRSEVIK